MAGKIGILKIGMAVGLGGITRGLNQASTTVSNFSGKLAGIGARATMAFGQIGLAVQGVKAIMSGLSAPFSLVNELEQASAAFEVLTGSSEAASKLIGETQALAAQSAVGGAANIQKAAKTMMGFGIATDKVMPSLKALSDIAAGSPERFESLALAFSQSAAAGRLMGQDLLQMINAGFNPLQQMSKDTGKSIIQLKKDMENGLISFSMVEAAFQKATQEGGKFYGMNEKIAGTMGGVWNQIASKVSLSFTKISQSIFKALNITGFLKWASSMVDVVVPYIERFVTMVGDLIGSIKFNTAPILDWLYQRWVFVSGIVSSVVSKMSGLVSAAFSAIGSAIAAVFPIWEGLSSVAGAALLFVTDLIVGAGNIVAEVFTYITDWIGTNIISWNDFKSFVVDALNVIEFSLLNWKDVLAYVGVALAASVVKWVNDFIWFGENMVLQIWGAIKIGKDLFLAMAGWYLTIFENLVTNIVTIWKNLGPLIRGEMDFKDMWKPLTEGFAMEIQKLPELTKRETGKLEQSLNQTANSMAEGLGKGYDQFLANKEKMGSLKMPEWKLPEVKKELKLDTTAAQTAVDGIKPPEIATVDKALGKKAQIGTLEGRNALLQNAMGQMGGGKDKAITETANNTATTATEMTKAVGFLSTIAGGARSGAATVSIP